MMRRRFFFWFAVSFAIALSGCATLRDPAPLHQGLDVAKACAEWRWIGISRSGERCPEIPGWTVRPLFAPVDQKTSGTFCVDGGSEKEPDPKRLQELDQKLNRFCVYEDANRKKWLEFHPPPPPMSAELVRVDRDCAALSLSGETEAKELEKNWESLSKRLREQTGMPSQPFDIRNPNGVRLAFLDTQPKGDIPATCGNSTHGFTLAHIGRHIACPQDSCAAHITTRLALPIVKFNAKSWKLSEIDTTSGGFMGLQSQLAEAIRSEVEAWQGDRRQGGRERHLVLNLSLAWDSKLFGGLDSGLIAEMQAGTQAVYYALQYAAAFDVLVLAAAGNQKGEPCDNFGPLLPAAWERGSPRESCDGEREKQPLLYAVGGLGADGRRLFNARPGGMPRRAAYGENAVVSSPNPRRHTAMLTGSSVSTAVASSIAAVVWSFYPALKPAEVMDILDRSGEELRFRADFWFQSGSTPNQDSPAVHRLSLCTALQMACAWPGSVISPSCERQFPCERPWKPEDTASLFRPGNGVPGSCQPWLFPQPEIPPCLSCGPPSKGEELNKP